MGHPKNPQNLRLSHHATLSLQVSARDMDELHALSDLVGFLREYPEELYTEKKAAVYRLRPFFQWAGQQPDAMKAAEYTLQQVCR